MATLKYYNGSAWTTVADGTAFKYYNGSAWTNPNKVQYYDGSNWQTVWNKSDPVKYTFVANRSKSFRHNDGSWSTSPTAAAVRNGVFSGSTNFILSKPFIRINSSIKSIS